MADEKSRCAFTFHYFRPIEQTSLQSGDAILVYYAAGFLRVRADSLRDVTMSFLNFPDKSAGSLQYSIMGTDRTYEPVKLVFGQYHHVFQTDRFSGQVVEDEKATETHVVMDVEMVLRGVKGGFEVLGIIEGKQFDKEKLAAKVRAALVAGLPKRAVFDLYKVAEIRVKADGLELDTWEAEATVDDMMAPKFEEQAKKGLEAISSLRTAISDIEEGLNYDDRRKVQNGLVFLEAFNRANNCGTMYQWCEEKLSLIRHGLIDLARRKDRNHPNYTRTLENIRGWINSWPKRNFWHCEPQSNYSSASTSSSNFD